MHINFYNSSITFNKKQITGFNITAVNGTKSFLSEIGTNALCMYVCICHFYIPKIVTAAARKKKKTGKREQGKEGN